MREQQAKDFWSVYLKLILRKGQETTIVNPFEEFRDSSLKAGTKAVSDEEYANIYDQVEELSVFWQQQSKRQCRTYCYRGTLKDTSVRG